MNSNVALATLSKTPNHSKYPMSTSEYFAGIGLVRLGLERAGWRVSFANDISDDKYQMYAAYFDDAPDHYIVEDVFKLDVDQIPQTTLATASFPCIDLSLAGKQGGLSGVHSSAFWGFIRVLEKQTTQPPLVMLENVNGWLTSNGGNDFRTTIQALNQLGYGCDVYCLDAIRFTPQSRPRVFVIGRRIQRPNQDFWSILQRPDSMATNALKNAIKDNLDLAWNVLDVPQPPSKKQSGLSILVENLSEDDPRWWSTEEVQRHLNMMAESHRARIEQFRYMDKWSYRTMYRRVRQSQQRAEVRADDTAGCLRTASGGSSRQMLVRSGKGQVRMRHMTPREYARLQGVPDDYPLPKQVNRALNGFGDAVCVPVITWLAENVLNPLVQEVIENG